MTGTDSKPALRMLGAMAGSGQLLWHVSFSSWLIIVTARPPPILTALVVTCNPRIVSRTQPAQRRPARSFD